MSSSRAEVLLWAQRVMARKGGPAHLLLEVRESCTPEQAQEAFHKVARNCHPDLHRHGLTPEEIEMVTSAYAAVAGAYMTLRSQTMPTQRMKPLSKEEVAAAAPSRATPIPGPSGRTPVAGVPTSPPAEPTGMLSGESPQNAAQQMSSKAVNYFRKAESALKRGDLKSAVLQIKLAIAADPSSTFLRNALAEIDAELRKGT